MNLLKVIKSNQFALWVAILSVIVQSFHSYTAFYNTSSLAGTGWGIGQAVLFAVVIDLAILFYTVRQRKDIALYAAFVMVIINSYYYYQHLGLSFQFAFGCFLSLIIPTSVYFYSEEIKEDNGDVLMPQHVLHSMEAQIKTQNDIIINGKAENKRLGTQVAELDDHLLRRLADLDEMTRLRDMAIQSESMTKQAFKKHLESLGETMPDDKSLLNIRPDRITSATIPDKQ